MIRNLKVLGLALVAVFVMSAFATSAASADSLTSESSPVTLTGKQVSSGDVFTLTIGTAKCKEIRYTATMSTPTTTFSLTPSFPVKTTGGEQNCSTFGFPGEIHTNGCTYLFHIGAATTGTLDIVCPEGKEVTITAGTAGTTKCTMHVPAQSSLATVTYKNVGSLTTREIELEFNITNIKYSHTEGTGLGKCATGSATTGSYVGKALLTGEEDKALEPKHVGIFLS